MNKRWLVFRPALFGVLRNISYTICVCFAGAAGFIWSTLMTRYGIKPFLLDLWIIAIFMVFVIFYPILKLLFGPFASKVQHGLDVHIKASIEKYSQPDLVPRIATVILVIANLALIAAVTMAIIIYLRCHILDPEPNYLYETMVSSWWSAKFGVVTSIMLAYRLGSSSNKN